MTRVIIFTHKATPEHNNVVNLWSTALGIAGSKVYNIPHYRPEDLIQDNDIVITFGKFAELSINSCLNEKHRKNVRHFKLPHPRQLAASESNKEYRELAFKSIEEIKKLEAEEIFQPEVIKITEKDLPDLDKKEILMLQKITEESGKGSCYQTSKNGNLIRIGGIHQSEDKGTYISLAFEELYAIRHIMDVLGVSEVTIERAPSKPDSGNTKKAF